MVEVIFSNLLFHSQALQDLSQNEEISPVDEENLSSKVIKSVLHTL
jgi:hypothetical protein